MRSVPIHHSENFNFYYFIDAYTLLKFTTALAKVVYRYQFRIDDVTLEESRVMFGVYLFVLSQDFGRLF